jgi:hypothetical protein
VAPPRFRRLVLGLDERTPGSGLRLASELARQLRLDLHGLFVEDAELLGLAALPFAREISVPGGDWRPLEAGRIAHELRLEARRLERQLASAARALELTWRFEVLRGSARAALVERIGAGDILVLIEPASAVERATGRFRGRLEAAIASHASVLLVPPRIARQSGPVVALATSEDDPSVEAAAALAEACAAELVVLSAAEAGRTWRAPLAPDVVAGAFGPLAERLVVVARGRLERDVLAALSAARAVPVLAVEDG